MYSVNARPRSVFAARSVKPATRPSTIAAKLPSSVTLGRRQNISSHSSYGMSVISSVAGTSLVVTMSTS